MFCFLIWPVYTKQFNACYLPLLWHFAFSDTKIPTSEGREGGRARGGMLSASFRYWEMWELTSVRDNSSQTLRHTQQFSVGFSRGNVLWYSNSWLQIRIAGLKTQTKESPCLGQNREGKEYIQYTFVKLAIVLFLCFYPHSLLQKLFGYSMDSSGIYTVKLFGSF